MSKPAISAWSTKPAAVKASKTKAAPGGLGRSGLPTATSHPFSDTFSVPLSDIETGKAMNELLKKVQDATGAVIESSTQMRTGLKTFLIKASDQKRLSYARKQIERGLSKTVTIQVDVPITTLGTIIGPKGATLKSITDSTSTKIDVPRRDTLPTYDVPDDVSESSDAPEEPQVAISITGPSVACNDAKAKVLALISSKVSQGTTSIKTIPSSLYPFISGPKGSKIKELEDFGEGQVKVHVPPPAVWKALQAESEDVAAERDVSIKVKGDKEKVKAVVAEIFRRYEEINDSLRDFGFQIPKRQHRFLVGAAADDILSQTGCIVELPPVDNPSDQCTIRGPQASIIPALTLVMEKANAIAVETVDVVALHRANTSDPVSHAKKVLRYLQRASKLRAIADANAGAKVYPPFPSVVESTGAVVIEIVGEDKAAVSNAKAATSAAVKAVLPAAISTVDIDPIVHAILIGKKGAKIATFESANSVTTVFPPAAEGSSEVLLVYTGDIPADAKTRDSQLKEKLAKATAALNDLAKDAADIKTETLDVDKKWHKFIIGQGGTVLNALIGEDGLVVVKIGAKAAGDKEDQVTVRGPSSEVDRVVERIHQIVEDAKNDDIINGFTVQFSVDKKYVPHLVGSSGSAINKLRESLGVKVNFDDDEKTKRVVCKIVGRKEAVEEAKRRLTAQIEKLEDETTDVVKIARAIQPALIGSGGKYAIRLEDKYGVKLSFPREKEGTKPDEVTIRGGRKGVAAAKAELLEAAAFEAESRQSLTFTVPYTAVASIVGRSGATIKGIKEDTGAQIDIDQKDDKEKSDKANITVRGDKKAIAAAKAAILEIAEELGDETTITVTIDPKYHRSLIGQGGQKLRDTIASVGGPAEGYKQSGLVTFPKQGDDVTDQVRLRGNSKIVKALEAELRKQVDTLASTIVVGVVVPKEQHASKIGRGGAALQDLQRKTGAVVHFPGSRQYGSAGSPDNTSELADAKPEDIVKVIGTKEATAKAAELLSISSERPQRGGAGGRSTPDLASRSISIPNKYYHALADQPNLIRTIRGAGGNISIPQPGPPKPVIARPISDGVTSLAAKAARIDVGAEDELVEEGDWEIRENHADGAPGELDWVVRAKADDLDAAVAALEKALDHVKAATHDEFEIFSCQRDGLGRRR